MLEREAELEQIAGALEDAGGGSGRLLVLCASAGMRKTRLLASAGEEASARGFVPLAARGSELEQDFPLGLARQLFDSLLRRLTATEREQAFSGAAAPARQLLGLGTRVEDRKTPPGAGLHALYWLLANVSDERPVALLVDDAQWADEATLAFLAFLLQRLDDVSVALLMAIRSGERTANHGRTEAILAHPAAQRLAPAPLSPAAVASIVGDLLAAKPAPAFIAACSELTGGNPFYVRELCRELGAAGVKPTAANTERVCTLGPENISHLVLRRVGRASGDGPALARSLAILGDGTELRLAAALAGLGVEAATQAVSALARADVLADERLLRFVHPIVRAAIATDLSAVERAEWHGRAARTLGTDGAPTEQVASHLLASEPLGDSWAVEQLRAASRVTIDRGAPATAAQYLRRALNEPAGTAAPQILCELGAAEFSAGDSAGLEHLEQSLAQATEPRERAVVARTFAPIAAISGNARHALEILSAARDGVAAEAPELALELSAELSGIALLVRDSADSVIEPLLRFEHALGATAPERLLLANVASWLATTGAPATRCAEVAARALAGGHLLAEASAESPAFHHAVYVLISADRFTEARRCLDEALEDARRRGSIIAFAVVSVMRSLLAYRLGRLSEAEAEARGSIDATRHYGWQGLPFAVAFLVDALIDRGRLEEAQRLLDGSDIDSAEGAETLAVPLRVARGRVRLATGDSAGGAEDLLEAGRRSDRGGDLLAVGAPTFRTYVAPALGAVGEQAEARRLIAEELELARNWGAARGVGMALHAAGLVESDEPARKLLQDAVATLQASEAHLEHARALVDLGAALRRSGHASDARVPLREGMDLAHRCGAEPLTGRAREELAASGVRRRNRTLLSGVESLTPSELRIAEIAAAGRTNREIAQALFVSRKTVEMHLRNAYRKLDISSRAELPQALTQTDGNSTP